MQSNDIPVNCIINGTYKIICPIGSGGTGIIYLAEHLHLRKRVVLKKIKNNLKNSSVVRQEADILKSLHHMYLPQVYDFIEYNGNIFTVIDYIEGDDLEKYYLHGVSISEHQLVKWMIQMCDTLSYIHSRNPKVLHNDIKPANIIINRNGDICLIDFNISTDAQDVVLGFTAGFTSPEQYYRMLSITEPSYRNYFFNIDERSDLYSLGAAFYALASHSKPSVYAVISGTQPPLYPEVCGFSTGFCKIINRLMNPYPENRYSSAAELKRALNVLVRHDVYYQRFLLMQAGILLISGIMVISGIWMIFHGTDLERSREFNSRFSSLSSAYEANEYSKAVDLGIGLLNDDSYSRIIDSGRKGRIYYIIAMSYYGAGQYYAAAEMIEEAVNYEKDAEKRKVYKMDGSVIYAYLGNYSRAQELLDSAYADGIGNAGYMVTMAQIKFAQKDYDGVIMCYNSVNFQELSSESQVKLYELAGDSYINKGDNSGGAEMFENAYRISGSISAARKLGMLFFEISTETDRESEKLETLGKSAAYYAGIIQNEFSLAEDFVNLSKIYRATAQTGRNSAYYSEAEKILHYAEEKFPNDYRIYQQLAITCYNMNKNGDAKKYCNKAFELFNMLPPDERESQQNDDMNFLYSIREQINNN